MSRNRDKKAAVDAMGALFGEEEAPAKSPPKKPAAKRASTKKAAPKKSAKPKAKARAAKDTPKSSYVPRTVLLSQDAYEMVRSEGLRREDASDGRPRDISSIVRECVEKRLPRKTVPEEMHPPRDERGDFIKVTVTLSPEQRDLVEAEKTRRRMGGLKPAQISGIIRECIVEVLGA